MNEEFDLTPEDDSRKPASAEENADNSILSEEDDMLTEEDSIPLLKLTTKHKIILVSIGAAILVGILGTILGLLLFSGRNNEDDRILQNVFAGGVELSGMTIEEAVNALHLATDNSISKEPLVVRIYDGTLTLYPDQTNAILDVEAVAQAAYRYGRSGNHADDQQIRKNAHRRSYTIPLLPYLDLDLDFIRNTTVEYCSAIDSMYAEPVISLIGTKPIYGDPSPSHQSIRVTIGTPLRSLDAEDLYNQILDAFSMNELLLEYETPEVLWPSKVTAQSLFDQYCDAPQDAVLNPTTYEITPEVYGYGFQIEDWESILNEAEPGDTFEIRLSFLEPDVLSDDFQTQLFAESLITYNSSSPIDDNARDRNLQLSCKAINGYIIKPGETFSFRKAVGEITAGAGYVNAPISKFNDSVLGGGISQTATALYYCALHTDMNIVERHNHKYTTDFIELGFDAYVDGSSKDLRFRNDTGMPIKIEASVDRHTVSISMRAATKLSYMISVRTQITSTEAPLTTYQMLLPNNSQGYQEGDIMVEGIEGYQVSATKEKLDASSGSLLSTSSVSGSTYKKRDAVIARIGVFDVDEPTQSDATESTENTTLIP